MRKLILLLLFAYPALGQGNNSPLVASSSATGNITATGSTCATTNACVSVHLPPGSTSVAVTVTGTWSATLVVEMAADNGVTWVSAGTGPSANGQNTYTLTAQTDFRVRCSAFTSGTVGVFINVAPPTIVNLGQIINTGGVAVGGTFGGSPSSAYTFSVSAGTVTAINNTTGVVAFSGTDAAVVINSALAAIATTGGMLYFKNGVYNLNSATQESIAGCTNFYSIGIPANATTAWVQFHFEGESRTSWPGELLPASVLTNGVIFNVTASAITAAGSSTLFAIWQRPNSVGSGCALPTGAFSNELYFKNLAVRFPVNTRGSEGAIVPWAASTIDYENVLADFNQTYSAIATGSAPTSGAGNLIGLASTYSSSGNLQHFKDTYVVGYNIGYDLESEHVVGDTMTAIYCNVAAEFGRQGSAVFHPSVITKFTDQENGAGFIFGPQMVQGSRVDLLGLDFEFGNDANWYSTARAKTSKLSETNTGYTSGIVTYEVTLANVGAAAELPATSLFTSGGQNFQAFEGTTAPNIAQTPVSDTFTRANNIGTGQGNNGLGPQWLAGTQAGNFNLKILSNAATVNTSSGGGGGYSNYAAQSFNSDQFSKLTISAIDVAASFAEVLTNSSSNGAVQTYYSYYCGGNAASGRGIIRVVAGVSTTLSSQTSAPCVATDTIELRHIGSTLWAYRNGALDTTFINPVTDSTNTGGSPGINLVNDVVNAVSVTNFSGGNFPTMHGTDSIYANDAVHSAYRTISNCAVNSVSPAACGSAPSGVIVVPTLTTTYTVNTTAVTANSRISLQPTSDNTGIPSAPTCATLAVTSVNMIASRVAGTSFTFSTPSTTGTTCFYYWIVN
jgi:hypothetical protein